MIQVAKTKYIIMKEREKDNLQIISIFLVTSLENIARCRSIKQVNTSDITDHVIKNGTHGTWIGKIVDTEEQNIKKKK